MPHHRFYLSGELIAHEETSLGGDEYHHMKNVMRVKEGDVFEVFNGKGILAEARVSSYQKNGATIYIDKVIEVEKKPLQSFNLAIAMIKLPRLEIAIEKCTEMGCSHFFLYDAKYSEKTELSINQRARLDNLIISAAKQSGRLWLPSLDHTASLMKLKLPGAVFFGDTYKEAPLFSSDLVKSLNQPTFIIGPEKGFHTQEVEYLKTIKAHGVKLGPHILRAETAAMTAASLMALYELEHLS